MGTHRMTNMTGKVAGKATRAGTKPAGKAVLRSPGGGEIVAHKLSGGGWSVREARTRHLPKPVAVPGMSDALREVKDNLVR